MKYFYIRNTGTISGNVGKNINIITNEEQLVSSINKGDIDRFHKVKAFKVGDTVQMASKFDGCENNEKYKPYENAFVEVIRFDAASGHLKIVRNGEAFPNDDVNFYIHDVKKEE